MIRNGKKGLEGIDAEEVVGSIPSAPILKSSINYIFITHDTVNNRSNYRSEDFFILNAFKIRIATGMI